MTTNAEYHLNAFLSKFLLKKETKNFAKTDWQKSLNVTVDNSARLLVRT